MYTNEVFDFESQTSFTLSFKVRDQDLETDAIWDLSVAVTNVNEAPSLSCEAENSAITFAEDTVKYSQTLISRGCQDYFLKSDSPEV